VTTSSTLLDSNNDGVTDAHDIGFFSFVDLQPGVYVVKEIFTDNIDWGATVDHNDADLLGDNITTVTVGSGDELVSQAGLADLIPGQQEVNVGYNLIFGNMELGGCGLSPGFWAQHVNVWNGIENDPGRDGKNAQNLQDAGTVIEKEIMDLFPLADLNGDGAVNASDRDIDGDGKTDLVFHASDGRIVVIEWDDAIEIINASQTSPNKLADFARMAINAFLNDVGTPNFQSVNDILADAADWMLQVPGATTGVNSNGAGDPDFEYYVLNYDNKSTNTGEQGTNGFPVKVTANSALWQSASDGPDVNPDLDVPAGSTIFNALAATICAEGGGVDLTTNASGTLVVLGQCGPDYFAVDAVTENITDGYLKLFA